MSKGGKSNATMPAGTQPFEYVPDESQPDMWAQAAQYMQRQYSPASHFVQAPGTGHVWPTGPNPNGGYHGF